MLNVLEGWINVKPKYGQSRKRVITMTIDEAIKHCEEVAEKQQQMAVNLWGGGSRSHYIKCQERASERRQLAEWLRELVHLRNITEYLRNFIDCFGSMDSMYYNEDIIKWAEEELRVEMREVNADEDSN